VKRAHFALFVLTSLVGIALGLGVYTFGYAKGWSYLTNDPRACANCHVMHEQYDGWLKGSHRSVATCNDCHTPHDFVGKYVTKARNGFWHSYYFTLGGFHEPIQITARNREITENACLYCHESVVQAMGTPAHAGSREISCIRCHGSVGHLELSATNVGMR
jgi:cytochrome c nitrite reductase small subunit